MWASFALFRWTAMDFMDGSLIGAFDEHLINVDVRRTAGHPNQRFSDVLTRERFDAFIYPLRPSHIPLKTHQRELRLCHSRIDRSHAHPCATEFQPQSASDLKLA